MCGIVGFVNYKKDINNPVSILNEMNHSLTNRGPVEGNDLYFFSSLFSS